jgi:flagellum-specific ATP synthase
MTLVATVLSDGGDEREPLSDAARSLLDGHIVLSSALARRGHYPAIDVLASASRTMDDVVTERHRASASALRRALALLDETRDARELGLARSTPSLDRAVAASERIDAFLRQRDPAANPSESIDQLVALALALSNPAAA